MEKKKDIKKSVAFHTLGCKVNSYETEAMRQSLIENGYDIVDFAPGADIYIVNTCTVTNIADRKSRQILHRARKMNPDALVVAVGCYVQATGEELLKNKSADIVIGTNRKSEIVSVIESYYRGAKNKKHAYFADISKSCGYDYMEMSSAAEHTRAFLKIQDGCNQFCSYCIIPYARGRIRSRELEDLRAEVERLAQNGYQEVVLTGIHLSSYGQDLGASGEITLLDAVNTAAQVLGIQRVRLGSLEQGIITEDFVKALAENDKFCPHFHLSLQSGSKGVLKRMNRHYTPGEYLDKCRLIRSYFDKPALTTDVIVGFPGETDEEFEETERFLQEAAFSKMHIFKYSMRKGTVAAKMEQQVSDERKTKRSERLLELNDRLEREYRAQFLGSNGKVLLEEEEIINKKRYFVGYTPEYIKVAVPVEELADSLAQCLSKQTDQTNGTAPLENLAENFAGDFPESTAKTPSDRGSVNKIVRVNFKKLLNKEILLAELVKIY